MLGETPSCCSVTVKMFQNGILSYTGLHEKKKKKKQKKKKKKKKKEKSKEQEARRKKGQVEEEGEEEEREKVDEDDEEEVEGDVVNKTVKKAKRRSKKRFWKLKQNADLLCFILCGFCMRSLRSNIHFPFICLCSSCSNLSRFAVSSSILAWGCTVVQKSHESRR